jgi:hypothetical protein
MNTQTSNTTETLEIRELTMDELNEASGAGIRDVLRAIKCLFGGCGPKQPPRGPHNRPADHLK